jgi:hypothetical protein
MTKHMFWRMRLRKNTKLEVGVIKTYLKNFLVINSYNGAKIQPWNFAKKCNKCWNFVILRTLRVGVELKAPTPTLVPFVLVTIVKRHRPARNYHKHVAEPCPDQSGWSPDAHLSKVPTQPQDYNGPQLNNFCKLRCNVGQPRPNVFEMARSLLRSESILQEKTDWSGWCAMFVLSLR